MKIDIHIIPLAHGKIHLAATTLGGITIRGLSAPEPGDAVRNLLWKLSGKDGDDDARIAVELALADTDLSTALSRPELGDGE